MCSFHGTTQPWWPQIHGHHPTYSSLISIEYLLSTSVNPSATGWWYKNEQNMVPKDLEFRRKDNEYLGLTV